MNTSDYFDVADSLRVVRHADDIETICNRCADVLGFEHFIYGAYLPVMDDIVVLDGFPAAWREQYVEARFLEVDPTVRHCSQNTTILRWTDIKPPRGRRAVAEQSLMAEAATHGLKNGLSVPVHGAGAEWGMLSLSSGITREPRDLHTHYTVQFLAQSIHEAVKRVNADSIDAGLEQKRLTDRERECLQWTANGKTAWEISRILNLSESTVTFHLKNAIHKMEVTNRPHAVAKALAQSRITLF